jgi:putative alpha-1,2-mannosidase
MFPPHPTRSGDSVVVRVATSLISAAQAEANHQAEVKSKEYAGLGGGVSGGE